MTFTKDNWDEAGRLHAKLNQRLQAWRVSQNYETKLAYRLKKNQVRSFWLRHGEDTLVALAEARGENETLMLALRGIRSCVVDLAQNLGDLDVDAELLALLEFIDDADDSLRAAEEEE